MNRTTAIVGTLSVAIWSGSALRDWETYEETWLKGTISGIIKQGTVFQTVSGSVYEVTEVTIDVVVLVMPKVVVLQDGANFKLIIEDLEAPLNCKQLVPPTRLASPPKQRPEPKEAQEVLPDGKQVLDRLLTSTQQKKMGLDKLTDSERERLGKFLAQLYRRGVEDGQKLRPDDASPQEARLASATVIESTVDGTFEGWTGTTIVKLTNGQIWQQSAYHYHYHYAYRPNVLIYQSSGVYRMRIEGDHDEPVAVKRLK